MPEMGVEGEAGVLSVEPCPAIEAGAGRVVTALFRHSLGEPLTLRLEGSAETIHPTPLHPFWCENRETWTSAADLQPGDLLRTGDGRALRVESIDSDDVETPVFNIEVDGDHVYRVGESGVLAHNASLPGPAVPAGKDYKCGNRSGNGNCGRGKLAISVPSGYEGHHLIGITEAEMPIVQRACKLGYDINRKSNGIALPSYGNTTFPDLNDGQDESEATGLPLHRGRHAAANYTDCARKHLQKLQEDYLAGVVTDCNLCAKLGDIEDELRRALLAHEIWLNLSWFSGNWNSAWSALAS